MTTPTRTTCRGCKTMTALLAVALGAGGLLFAAPARATADDPTTAPAATTRPSPSEELPAEPLAESLTESLAEKLAAYRAIHMRGDYEPAARRYEKLLGDDVDPAIRVSAAVGLADALVAQGDYAAAIAGLEKVRRPGLERADWRVAMAEALSRVGRYGEALEHARAAHEKRPGWAPPILALGRLLETLGRKDEAVAVYRSMDKVLAGQAYRKDAASLVALGQILDRTAVLTGRRASEQAENILHNYLQAAYLEADPTYWPANVAAGVFLLSRHKTNQAQEEFELVARHNKKVAEVHVAAGAAMLEGWRFEQCMGQVTAALAINPHHADALLLKATCLMQWRKYDQVPAVLEQILAINPNHLEALGLAAARSICLGDEPAAEPYIQRVAAINPACAELHGTIGDWLAARRQFKAAREHYLKAIELAPEQAGPVTNLGLLYMQTGDEDLAGEALARAHELDDYRADVVNYLNVLDRLKGFAVRETEHFIIRASGEHDAVLLNLIADYAEEIYPEVCAHFAHEPEVKTIVEVFPTHPQFSVRITGRGWIGTVGASTGRVIAMVAPDRERSEFGTYNWAAVLRHEFTHTVTLSATNNHIPHWFTEACAVFEQPDRRNYDAVNILVNATREGTLFPVRELNWGFTVPKRRGDRSLAYAESEWMIEYIIATRGYPAVLAMLKGFRDGRTQAEVFAEVLETTEDAFDASFREWAKDQVREWGFDPDPPPDVSAAEAAVAARPDDAAALAHLADAYFQQGRMGEARTRAEEALKRDPENVEAMTVLARVLLGAGENGDAIPLAEKLAALRPDFGDAWEVLARAHLAERRWGSAIEALEMLKQRERLDPWPYEQLATLYVQIGQPARALPNLVELHRRTMTDPQYARQVAEIYDSQMRRPDLALAYWAHVAYINPYDSSAYKAATGLWIQLEQYERAAAAAENYTLVQPESAEAWTYLAIVRYHLGREKKDPAVLQQGVDAARRALKIDPLDTNAQRVLKRLNKELGA